MTKAIFRAKAQAVKESAEILVVLTELERRRLEFHHEEDLVIQRFA